MNAVVVDASVGIKWFVPEIHSAEARQWRNGSTELHVPTFFFNLEITSILWKKVMRSEISRSDADIILAELSSLPITRHSEAPLLESAFDLANRSKRTVYDCLYLALAAQLQGRMVTADLKLFNSLTGTPWQNSICWVENVTS